MSNRYIGQILLVPYNFAPSGWIFTQGQFIAISQNTALFSLIGTFYGGNGSTTYQLPDLRGRVPIGSGAGPGLSDYFLGGVSGSESVSILTSNMPSHNHPMTGGVTVATTVGVTNTSADKLGPNGHILSPAQASTTPPAAVELYSDQIPNGALGGVSSAVTSTLGTGLTGSSLPISILQPYLVMNYVIALSGIFPARN